MKTNEGNQGESPLSERMLPFPNMTMMPRSVHKLPYHAPVTNNEMHPESNGKKNKRKKTKSKSKSNRLNELREVIRKIIRESDDWGDSDKIGRAASFEREGKKELYYVVDGQGRVVNLSTTPMSAQGFLEKNFSRLGGGQIKVAVVPKEHWDNEMVNAGNIKNYGRT